jgi:hypothetical protein
MKKKKPIRKEKSKPVRKPAKKSSNSKKIKKVKKVKKGTRGSKVARKKSAKKRARRKEVVRGVAEVSLGARLEGRRINPISAGASGDDQKLSRIEGVDSESVEELADEGQSYEAAAISGVEDALDPDQSEVTTKERPQDDVPGEYTDRDK